MVDLLGLMSQDIQILNATPSICPEGFFTSRYRPSKCLWLGFLVGMFSAFLGELVGFTASGHKLNDPILIVLFVNRLLSGLVYFDWRSLLISFSYQILLGVAAGFTIRAVARAEGKRLHASEARKTALVAALVSITPIWIQEVDSLTVFFWYAIATWVSTLTAGMVAARASR